jgi:hypothetical protein
VCVLDRTATGQFLEIEWNAERPRARARDDSNANAGFREDGWPAGSPSTVIGIGITVTCTVLYCAVRIGGFLRPAVHYKYHHSTGLCVRNETKKKGIASCVRVAAHAIMPCRYSTRIQYSSMQACVRCLISLLRAHPHSRPHSSDRSRRKGAGNNKWYTVRNTGIALW